MTEACRSDVRVSLLEVFVCGHVAPCQSDDRGMAASRRRRGLAVHIVHTANVPPGMWEQLDNVDARFEEDPHVVPISHGDVCEKGLDSHSGRESGRSGK